jgi:hypothetical protein
VTKLFANKYVQAALVAFATGLLNALLTYVTHITDGLDWRHMTQDVGIAFLGPFLLLVSVLPKVTDILTPTIRIVSNAALSELAPVESAEQEIVSTAPTTTVSVDASPVTAGATLARARPPAVPSASGRARAPAVPAEAKPQETSAR